MSTEPGVQERVLRILSEVTNNDEVQTQLDLPLYTSGLVDSLGTVTLIVAFDEEFGIKISPADFDVKAWATPRKLIADVQRRVATESGASV